MLAEVGAAALGYGADKLLNEFLNAWRHLKNRSANLLQLKNLQERLQPSVKELISFVQDEKHPAGKWVTNLREQLENSSELVRASGNGNRNLVRLYRTSKESLEVYDTIQALLREAAALQWASGIPIQRISSEYDAKRLVERRAAQERDEQLYWRIGDLTSKVDILSRIAKLEQVPNSEILDRSSSSAVPTENSSVTTDH